jgi:2-C-methyl-D-erythritol 4-phosphate cytidylyltransferase
VTDPGRVGILLPISAEDGALDGAAHRQLAGEPLLVHCVRELREFGGLDRIIVAVAASAAAAVRGALAAYELAACRVVVTQDFSRHACLRAGVQALDEVVEVVLVADVRRPLAAPALAHRVVQALLAGSDVVVPALPVVDTVKHVSAGGRVTGTVDRSTLRQLQAPRGFQRTVLEQGLDAWPDDVAADELDAAHAGGRRTLIVPGSGDALRVSSTADVALAEALLAGRRNGGRLESRP